MISDEMNVMVPPSCLQSRTSLATIRGEGKTGARGAARNGRTPTIVAPQLYPEIPTIANRLSYQMI